MLNVNDCIQALRNHIYSDLLGYIANCIPSAIKALQSARSPISRDRKYHRTLGTNPTIRATPFLQLDSFSRILSTSVHPPL